MMEYLPDEILLNIFSKLPLPAVLLSVRCTCWRWYTLSHDTILWKDIDLSLLKCDYSPENKARISEGVKALLQSVKECVSEITFGDFPINEDVFELSDDNITKITFFPFLKSLDFSYSKVKYRNLRKALIAHPEIEELKLSHTSIPFGKALKEVIHLPMLKKFVFHDMSIAWDTVLSRHFDEQAHLKIALMLVPKHCPLLEVIDLHTVWCYLDDEAIQQFTRFCPNLRKASFTWSSQITGNAFQYLNLNCHKITELVLSDRQAWGPYLDFVLPYFPSLLELSVSGHNVHIEDCRAIGNHCPLLKKLTFERGGFQAGEQIFDVLERGDSLCGPELNIISEKCNNLRKLHAPCSDIDDQSVLILSQQCPHLEDINFSQCKQLTNKSIRALAKNSLCLKKINFFEIYIHSLSYEILCLFTEFSKLEDAIFDQAVCGNIISQESCEHSSLVSEIVSNTPEEQAYDDNLISFEDIALPLIDTKSGDSDFYDVLDGIKEQELISNPNNILIEDCVSTYLNVPPIPCPYPVKIVHCHLKRLSLKNCLLEAKHLQKLFKECPDLTYVSLDGSTGVTDETIITLVRSCPCLKTLSIQTKPKPLYSVYGDSALLEIAYYGAHLEAVNLLYNDNITAVGLTAIFLALETTMSSLHSLSLCIGKGYQCSIQTVIAHGLKNLTKASKNNLKGAAATNGRNAFLLLHLEYKRYKM